MRFWLQRNALHMLPHIQHQWIKANLSFLSFPLFFYQEQVQWVCCYGGGYQATASVDVSKVATVALFSCISEKRASCHILCSSMQKKLIHVKPVLAHSFGCMAHVLYGSVAALSSTLFPAAAGSCYSAKKALMNPLWPCAQRQQLTGKVSG